MAKIGLAVGGAAVAWVLVLLVARCWAWSAGIRDPDFRYENEIAMWRPDAVLGFANRGNVFDYCFGTVQVITNGQGFRGRASIPRIRDPHSTRIIGIGDSVMWGTCVDDSESFLGLLGAKLTSHGHRAEVINAGVVGFSTLQESLLLEKLLVEFSPDVVMINLCENDLLPTEDPFDCMRDFHIHHADRYLNERGSALTGSEREAIRELIRVFESPVAVHTAMSRSSSACRRMAVRLFFEIPIRRMVQLTRATDTELIYLLIPPRDEEMAYLDLARIARQVLDETQTAYLDLGSLLKGGHADHKGGIFPDRQDPGWLPRLEERLLPDARAIRTARHIDAIHRRQNYIDRIHPSKRGNEIIAQRIFDYLMAGDAFSSSRVE